MKFLWSTLNVRNMEESLDFYQEVLGLPLNHRFQAGPDMEIAFLGDGETKIELIADRSLLEVDPGKHISWGFQVESLEVVMENLSRKHINILAGPFQPNASTRFLFIADPNGFRIQLVEENI